MDNIIEESVKQFSPAQLRVVLHLAEGKTNAQIATAMGLSCKTVKAHVTNIFKLSGCRKDREFLSKYFLGELTRLIPKRAA